MSSLPKLPTTTWGTESDANRIKKTYVKGYMDVSGGELSVHNTAFNVFNSNGKGVFRMDPQKMTVNDSTGQEVDISLSYLTFLNVLVPPDGKAVSIPDKVKYIFTVGTETRIGKSDASSNFRVYGNTYVEENLFVNMDASFGQRFLLMGDASLNSNLYVLSKTRLDDDLSLNGNFTMYGDASLNGRLMLSSDASLNSNLYVLSKTRLDDDLSLNGNFTMYGDASLNGRLMLSGDASFNSNLYVKSKTRLGNDLSLNGNFTMYGDASLNGRLMLSGDASLNSNLYVLSKTRLGNDLSLNGNFTMYGDASLNGRLMLSGDASLNSNLYVLSKTRLGNDVSLNGNFTMYGDASINGILLVSKDASLNGNLYVRGRTTFYEPSGSVITSGTSRGTLNLTHGDASGGSSILFQSVNSADDYAYIQYQENVPYAGQTSLESGLLTIGIENEITGVNRDRIALISANGSGNVGVNTKFPNYNLDVSGQMRICEGTGTTASATTGSMILEHTAVGGTSSIMFKGPNSTTNDYAYIQYEDNTAYTLPVLKYDFATDVGSMLTTGVPSTGSNPASITSAGNISSVLVSGLNPLPTPNKFPSDISCLFFNQTNLTFPSSANISFIQTQSLAVTPFSAGGFTFSAWIRPIKTSEPNCRFYILNISPSTITSNFDIYIDGDSGRIAAICGEDSTNYRWTNVLTQNEWRHYAFTFDNATSTGNHYLDGSLVIGGDLGTKYSGKQLTATNQSILMGVKYGYTNGGQIGSTGKYAKGFHGYMNYVNMFGRALSATDIAVLYNTPGYTQSTINRGLMTFGIENEPGSIFNDRIALMPANGSGFVGINTKTPAHTLSLGQLNADCKLALYDDGTGSNWYGIGANNYNLTFGAAVGTANQNEPQMKLSNTGSLDIKNSLSIGRNNTITLSPTTNPKIEFGNGAGISRWKIEDVVLNRDGGLGSIFDYGAQSKLIFSAKSNNLFNNTANDLAYIDGMTLVPNSGGNGALSTGVNVGIGTTNPTYNLDVRGTINATGAPGTLLRLQNTSGYNSFGNTHIDFWNSHSTPSHTGRISSMDLTTDTWVTALSFNVRLHTGDLVEGMRITGLTATTAKTYFNNIVGIGKTNPTYNLDVSGTVNATSYNATSDYRVKTDVKPLDASFNIDVLKPVTYTNTRHGRQDVGFIAHEVQEHYPFLVNGQKDGEQMQSLNYIGLIGILTKEIQDLKRRLAETEAKVASVETDVRTIETKVEEVDDIIISVEDTVLSVKNAVRTVDDKVSSVENKVSSVENKVSSVENKVSSVENTVSSVENKVSSVENTVLLEQARLTICETNIALNKSAIKDLDERFQS